MAPTHDLPGNPTATPVHPVRRRRLTAVLALTALPLLGLAACGDDADEPSAQEQFCEAGDTLRADVSALTDLNVVAEGTDALKESVATVRDDLAELKATGSDLAADDVAAIETAVDGIRDSIDALGDEGLSAATASDVLARISELKPAISGLAETMTTACD